MASMTLSNKSVSASAPEHAAFRRDIERLRSLNNEPRSPERLLAHFNVETELAARLRHAGPEQTDRLYGELYAELFAKIPDHPQHKIQPAKRREATKAQTAFLARYLRATDTYVEIGCGDGAVTQAIAPMVGEAIGIDVTDALIDPATANFRFLKTSGTDIGLASNTADLVYSNQLMEHLHPKDATAQLQEIHRILKPGGRYICVTPSRITGPHDISGYFAYEPCGFHLREYDYAGLAAIFRQAGFRTSKACITIKGRRLELPLAFAVAFEMGLLALPQPMRTRLAQVGPIRNLAGITLIGKK
jgi:SAM-dependent methyltransferase